MDKILVIDDQLDNIISIKAILKSKRLNYTVFSAMSGISGIEMAKIEQPDVILLDIIMPEMDGYETCKILKNEEKTKHIPIIMITAIKTDSESRAVGLDIGADAFLSKPIDPVELMAQINVMLRIKKAEDELRADKEHLDFLVKEKTHKLLKSEEKMRNIYKIVPTGIGIVKNHTITEINPKVCEMLGYSEEELIGRNISMLYPDDENQIDVRMQKFNQIEESGLGIVETRWKKKDGSIIHIYLTSTPFDKNDLSKGIISTALDITDRVKAEETIKTQAIFVQQNPAPVFSFVSSGEILFYNNSSKKIFENLETGTNVFSLLPALTMDIINNLKENKSIQIEEKIKDVFYLFTLKKDFETNAIYAFGSNISEIKRGELIQKVIFNISNAVSTEESVHDLIQKIRKELAKIIDTTNFHVALYDKKTDVISMPFFSNNKVELPEVIEGKTLTRYCITQNKSILVNAKNIEELRKSNEIRVFEIDPLIWLGVPLKKDGEIIGVLAVQSYTNQHAFSEADLKMLEFVSDQISHSILRKKYEDDLIKAYKKATESDQLKSTFLANMSHEIRTPMNGILGFSDLLKNPDLSGEQQKKYIGIIEKSGQRMLNIINDLINISKIEAGQSELVITEVNIKDKLEYFYQFFKPEAQNKGLDLTLELNDLTSTGTIKTDKEKLYAIISNLLKNAIKYTEKGKIEFGCTCKQNKMEFYVKDTGLGIEKDKQELIFERFVQADNSLSSFYEGAGLGLAITKSFVEMLGGKIWLESSPGKGSVFYFNLPIQDFETKTNPFHFSKQNVSGRTNNLKILVAEDEETAREYLKIVLKEKQVLFAKTGKEVVKIFKENQDINLILMDIKMPELDGYKATQQIRAFNKDVVIIAQTAYSMSGDKEKLIQAGCTDYISKPIDRNKLEKLLVKYFKN